VKTEEFIRALASDRTVAPPPARTLARDLACGGAVALAAFLLLLGLRPNLADAFASPRFVLKPVLTLSLFGAALAVLLRQARPGAALGGRARELLVAPVLLGAAVILELVSLPSANWAAKAVGTNSYWCLTMIPLLALAPLACTLHALRQAAPTRPTFTGAVAGLAAGALAATFYAFHCTDDSPLFVAIWYVLALAIVAAAGALCGSRLLRW
jgi:hypothetical protein